MEEKNLDIHGNKPIPWSRPLAWLEAGAKRPRDVERPNTIWLATVRPDGRPHVAGVGAIWADGKFYFVSGPGTRKSKDLEKNPNCVLSVILGDIDLTVDGTAKKVTDSKTLERLAQLYNAGGWPARVQDGALTAEYSAPSAGPPPWYLYAMTPGRAIGVTTAEPFGATRWTFD